MRINSVIVTYNRLPLLKECVVAVKNQTYPIEQIFIVDNNSKDGTREYLETLVNDDQIIVITLSENIGGAGGFSEGIKKSVMAGVDWVWVMDDDTVPDKDALKELISGVTVSGNVGYVCSKVVWVDGMVHKMNVPFFGPQGQGLIPINYYTNIADVLLIQSASFVSVLINSEAVYKVGLPIKEFFIWGDDIEFTTRISKYGYIGLYAWNSIAVHKTKVNYDAYLETAPTETAWKFRYGIRNKIYLRYRRRKNKVLVFFSILNLYRRTVRRLRNRTSEDKKIFIKELWKGVREGLTFTPAIEYLPKNK